MDRVAEGPNPLTGPFYIRGSQPGDTLSVTIHSIIPNRSTGFACKDIHPNLYDPPLPSSARRREYVTWKIDTDRGTTSPPSEYFTGRRVELPLKPVLGCIGLPLNSDERFRSIDCGIFGGNMDYPRITAGTTVHLPVGVEGGYLYLGDVHAVQGDGEITGNGIEVSSEVSFSVEVNHLLLQWPAGEDADYLFTIGNARPVEQAFRIATMQMTAWLQQSYGLNPDQIGLLMGQVVRYEVGNLVSNAYTGVCCFPKKYLE